MVRETNPMKKTPAEKKAEKESFLAGAPSNIETLSALVKSQQEEAQTLAKAAAEAPEMAQVGISDLERRASKQLYDMDPRIAAARGFDLEADFVTEAARMRQAAADRQLQLGREAADKEREALASEQTMFEQIEEEDTLETANAISIADGVIEKYYEAGQEWPMYQEAWQKSMDMSPNAFESFWSNIQASYNEMGGDHSSPLAHPLVQYNIRVGNKPLEGLTLFDTEEGGQKYAAYAKGRELLGELNTPEGMTYNPETGYHEMAIPQEEVV